MDRFTDRIAWITGAASGIGKASAHLLHREGAIVYAADVAPLDPVDDRMIPLVADVRSRESVDAVAERIAADHGGLDILVNAAGVADSPRRTALGAGAALEDIDDEDWETVVDINLSGSFRALRAAVPLMRARSGGVVVNISSIGALASFALPVAYPASKAGVLGLTRAAAALLADDGIRVNAVAPGATDTPMLPSEPEVRKYIVELSVQKRAASAEELAATVAFLASDDARFYTGQTLAPDGGYVMR